MIVFRILIVGQDIAFKHYVLLIKSVKVATLHLNVINFYSIFSKIILLKIKSCEELTKTC